MQQVQRSGEFPYPAFPCGPHQVTQVEVSSLLWFPPGSAHAVLEEAESVASAYELTPSAMTECKYSEVQQLPETNRVIAGSLFISHISRDWLLCRVQHPAETALASIAVWFISVQNWWMQHFPEFTVQRSSKTVCFCTIHLQVWWHLFLSINNHDVSGVRYIKSASSQLQGQDPHDGEMKGKNLSSFEDSPLVFSN